MAFYEELSAHYDEVFAPDPAETAFILERVRGRKRLLDIGCATGAKTALCAKAVGEAVGIDSDGEMIRRAQAEHSGSNITYRHMGMLEAGSAFPEGHFDAVLCLGNTLVHLPRAEDVETAAAGVFRVLEQKGVWIIQIINYDRIIDQNVDTLPRIETEHVVFERRYGWEDGVLRFMTTLTEKSSGLTQYNNIALLPLRRDALDKILKEAGFSQVDYYGSYTGETYSLESFLTIAVCRK